jgi:hypothetical protein
MHTCSFQQVQAISCDFNEGCILLKMYRSVAELTLDSYAWALLKVYLSAKHSPTVIYYFYFNEERD